MGTQVTCEYDVDAIGQPKATVAGLVASPPPPKDILLAFGVRVISDATVQGPPVARTIVFGFNPSVTGDASLTLNEAGVITAVTVGNHGLDYILPPIISLATFTPQEQNANPQLRAFMDVRGATVDAGGVNYAAPVVTFLGGLPPAGPKFAAGKLTGCVRSVNVKDGGLGYPSGTSVTFDGGGPSSATPATPAQGTVILDANGKITAITITDMGGGYIKAPQPRLHIPGAVFPKKEAKLFSIMAEGTPARAGAITVMAGAITAIAIATPGDNYVTVPDILIQDPTPGALGAVAHAQMGLGKIDIISPGKGITAAATVVVTPAFQVFFPSTVGGNDPNQQKLFFNLMTQAIKNAALAPVIAKTPVVA